MNTIVKESLLRCFHPLDLLNILGGIKYIPRQDYQGGGQLISIEIKRLDGRDYFKVKYYKYGASNYIECMYDPKEFAIKSCFE